MNCGTKLQYDFPKIREGGVIFNPKNHIAYFCHYKWYFDHEFWKNLQYDFPKMRGMGQRSFGFFLEMMTKVPFYNGNNLQYIFLD